MGVPHMTLPNEGDSRPMHVQLREAIQYVNSQPAVVDWQPQIFVTEDVLGVEAPFTTSDTVVAIRGACTRGRSARKCVMSPAGGVATRALEQRSGLVTVSDFEIAGFTAEVGSGGAVFLRNVRAEFDECLFRDNTAPAGKGGAIWAKKAGVAIYACEFEDNSARAGGSAVFIESDANAENLGANVFGAGQAVEPEAAGDRRHSSSTSQRHP